MVTSKQRGRRCTHLAVSLLLTACGGSGARELPLRDGLARELLARRLFHGQPRRPELPPPQHLAKGVDDRNLLRRCMTDVACVKQSKVNRLSASRPPGPLPVPRVQISDIQLLQVQCMAKQRRQSSRWRVSVAF